MLCERPKWVDSGGSPWRPATHEIARLINASLDADRGDCFLEPYAPHDEAASN
jgi:hypothetical protein